MVAAATNNLCEAANAAVQGHASEEKLISSAKQVAASTAQLLVACKVKADQDSEAMKRLQVSPRPARGPGRPWGKQTGGGWAPPLQPPGDGSPLLCCPMGIWRLPSQPLPKGLQGGFRSSITSEGLTLLRGPPVRVTSAAPGGLRGPPLVRRLRLGLEGAQAQAASLGDLRAAGVARPVKLMLPTLLGFCRP